MEIVIWFWEYTICLLASALVVYLTEPYVNRLERWVEIRRKDRLEKRSR